MDGEIEERGVGGWADEEEEGMPSKPVCKDNEDSGQRDTSRFNRSGEQCMMEY